MLSKTYPLASRMVVFLVLPVFLFLGYLYNYYIQSLPKENVTLVYPSLSGEVRMVWDKNGVAKIEATNANDVYFATGFAHAADRLWQLETQRRMMKGELSEVFGSQFLLQDIWIRMLGIEKSANDALQTLSPEALKSLQSYSDGVNAWLATNDKLPAEFGFFDIKPVKWRPVDSLGWSKMFALNLSSNMFNELTRIAAKEMLTDAQFKDVYPQAEDDLSYLKAAGDVQGLFTAILDHKHFNEEVMKSGGLNVGSNGWVVSGEHTVTGIPVLANDPHLGLQIPSLWYMVDQILPSSRVSGMSLVGLPLVIFGRNNDITWGATNMMADVQDLYIEKLNPANPNQYLYTDNSWREFQTQHEYIKVKSSFPASLREPLKPISVMVRHTENGPVVSDFKNSNGMVLSLKWTALLPGDTSYEAFFRITQASNWQEFDQAANLLQAPALNLLYADAQHIGYKGAGLVPVRSKGSGTLPVPGWIPEFQWQSFIPKQQMPTEFDPESGVIVSANNDPTTPDYPYEISAEWASPARAERIKFLLQSATAQQNKLSLQDHGNIQSDQIDSNYLQLVPLLVEVEIFSEREQQLVAALKKWQGDMAQDSAVALLVAFWIPELKKQLFDDEFKGNFLQESKAELLRNMLNITPNRLTLAALQGASHANWCDNVSTEEAESCANVLRNSLTASLAKIDKLLGSDINDWRLGAVQYTAYQHFPLSKIKLLGDIFDREAPNGGGGDSVNVAPAVLERSKGLVQTFGAGFRQIIEPGEHGKYWFMNSTGQSGNIFSQHYDDMVQPFNNVEFYSLEGNEESTASYILKPSY